ncbi:hypothetical protein DFH09DRAFT_1102810 [Mycena vulgaris]|nr:hypothetical protein DFH09DRAFT_1102810 [Mycena vulgaris]
MALNTGGTYFSRSLAALDRLGNMDEEATLAQVALARFTPGDRISRANWTTPKARPTPKQLEGCVDGCIRSRWGSNGRVEGCPDRGRILVTSPCGEAIIDMLVNAVMAWLSKNEEALSQMGLATGAQVEVYSKKKKWVAIAWNSPIQPLLGVPVLLLRLKGVTRQGEWDEYTAQYFK